MSALYLMRYVGQSGTGHAALYMGREAILGIDTGGCVYRGSYDERPDGGMDGEVTITAPATGAVLATGDMLGGSQSIPIGASLSADFGNETPQLIFVGPKAVEVKFEKIGDLP